MTRRNSKPIAYELNVRLIQGLALASIMSVTTFSQFVSASEKSCIDSTKAQESSTGTTSTTNPDQTAPIVIEKACTSIDIKDLDIPTDSQAIYIIKPQLPQKADSDIAPKVELPQPSKISASNDKSKAKQKIRTTPPMLTWEPEDGSPKCVLLCIHGLGLYNRSYEDFGLRMAKQGIAVCAIDVRGFGSWMAAKGHQRVDFDSCLADVQATLKVIHRAHPRIPVFILGESMGGAIALRSTALFPDLISGLISSVPAGDRFQQGKTTLKVAIHLLSDPNKPFNVGEGVIKQATVKPELREAWLSDPLDRLNLTPRELMQFQSFMNQNHESAKWITQEPVLIVQGCKDHLVKPEGTIELYNELSTSDKQLMLIPKSEHLIFEANQCPDSVMKVVVAWLNSHLPQNISHANDPNYQNAHK